MPLEVLDLAPERVLQKVDKKSFFIYLEVGAIKPKRREEFC